jgi:hypothetical protein
VQLLSGREQAPIRDPDLNPILDGNSNGVIFVLRGFGVHRMSWAILADLIKGRTTHIDLSGA